MCRGRWSICLRIDFCLGGKRGEDVVGVVVANTSTSFEIFAPRIKVPDGRMVGVMAVLS